MSIFVFYSSQWKCLNFTKNITRRLKYIYLSNLSGKQYSSNSIQNKLVKDEDKKCYVPFLEQTNTRREQARRSILVQVQSSESSKELYTYCNSIGKVKNMFHYSCGVEPMNFIIVEFADVTHADNVLRVCTHLNETQLVSTHSQFLWFRAANRKLAKLKQSSFQLSTENGTNIIKDSEINVLLNSCVNICDQITLLHNLTKLNDVGIRLRFLTARQIEKTISGIFPNATAYPFGSSVNGFGKMGCDLDLVLRLTDEVECNESRLIFHCKATSGSERSTSQRHMEAIGDLIHLFLPGCTQVRRILQARVPIIKYYQQFTDVECDLSMTNMSGVHMSDFLYLMGSIDERVRPLIFAVRKWAKEVQLTNSSPGRWITNFSLTLLVLAFLQKPLNSSPILPTLNTLVKLAGSSDKYVTEDGINCTFLRDITKLNFKTDNTESLENLLVEFFEYYSQFDFTNKAVCLNEAVSLTKPEYSAMYIVNPLERGLNVSKNVSFEELERFKVEVKNAAWTLESREYNKDNIGLLSIFNDKNKPNQINFQFPSKPGRLMDVSTLFQEEEQKEESEIEYKNRNLRKQIQKIKESTKTNIKDIQNLNR